MKGLMQFHQRKPPTALTHFPVYRYLFALQESSLGYKGSDLARASTEYPFRVLLMLSTQVYRTRNVGKIGLRPYARAVFIADSK